MTDIPNQVNRHWHDHKHTHGEGTGKLHSTNLVIFLKILTFRALSVGSCFMKKIITSCYVLNIFNAKMWHYCFQNLYKHPLDVF